MVGKIVSSSSVRERAGQPRSGARQPGIAPQTGPEQSWGSPVGTPAVCCTRHRTFSSKPSPARAPPLLSLAAFLSLVMHSASRPLSLSHMSTPRLQGILGEQVSDTFGLCSGEWALFPTSSGGRKPSRMARGF